MSFIKLISGEYCDSWVRYNCYEQTVEFNQLWYHILAVLSESSGKNC